MIIYKATNTINNKCYIGQTIKPLKQRMAGHKSSTKHHQGNQCFHKVIRKYGWNVFTWVIIEEFEGDQTQLDDLEHHYIKQFHSHVSENGYNLTWGFGNTTTGYKFTKEQLLAHSESRKGTKNPNYGNGSKISGLNNPAKRLNVRRKISKSKRPDVSSYRSKCYVIVNIHTDKEIIIHNLSKLVRDNPIYKITGMKNVINGKRPHYKDIWVQRLE